MRSTHFDPTVIGLVLGAGCGALRFEISKRSKGIQKVYAVEIVQEITEVAMCKIIEVSHSSKAIPMVGSFDDIQLNEGEVDWIVEFDSLHHSFNLQATLNEAARALKKEAH